VREALPLFEQEIRKEIGRYERFVVTMIKIKSVLGLYIIALYSQLRNKTMEES
jgi:hypothetical protein